MHFHKEQKHVVGRRSQTTITDLAYTYTNVLIITIDTRVRHYQQAPLQMSIVDFTASTMSLGRIGCDVMTQKSN